MAINTEISLDVQNYIAPLQSVIKSTTNATAFILKSFENIKVAMDLGTPTMDISQIQKDADAVVKDLDNTAKEVNNSLAKIGVNTEANLGTIGKKAGEKFNENLQKEVEKADTFMSGFKDKLLSGLTVGGGAALGAKAFDVLTSSLSSLWESAKAGEVAMDNLSKGFQTAGLGGEDLIKEIDRADKASTKLGMTLGVPSQKIRELSAAAASLGGATGEANEKLVKLALGAEQASGGLQKGEDIIKIFSQGIQDPANLAAFDALKASFPELATAIQGVQTPAEKTDAALEFLAGTFATMEKQTQGFGGVMANAANLWTESVQKFGGSLLGAIDLTQIFGNVDMSGALDEIMQQLSSLGSAIGKEINDIVKSISGVLSNIMPTLKAIAGVVGGVLAASFVAVKNAIVLVVDVVSELFKSINQSLINPIKEALGDVSESTFDISKAFKMLSDIFKTIFSVAKLLIQVALVPIRIAFEGLRIIITNLIEVVKNIFGAFADLGNAMGVANKEGTEGNVIFQGFSGTLLKIRGTLNGATKAFNVITDTIAKFVKSLLSFNLSEAIESFSGFGKKIGDAYNEGWNETVNEALADAKDNIDELNDVVGGEINPPKTEKAKKEITSLADYIQNIIAKIGDLTFDIKVASQEENIRILERQVKQITEDLSLSESARIQLTTDLQVEIANEQMTKDIEKLKRDFDNQVEAINKEFKEKTTQKGVSLKEVAEAENERNNLIEKLTLQFNNRKIVMEKITADKILDINKDSSKKVNEIIRNQDLFAEDLRTDFIVDEKQRQYEKDLINLKRTFAQQQEQYEGNNEILELLQRKFNKDMSELQSRFGAGATNQIDQIRDSISQLAGVIGEVGDVEIDDNERQRALQKQADDYNKALAGREISYSQYVSNYKSLSKEMVDDDKATIKVRVSEYLKMSKAIAENLDSVIDNYQIYADRQIEIDKEIADKQKALEDEKLEDEKRRAEIRAEINKLEREQEESNIRIFEQSLGQSKSIFAEQTAMYKAMAIAQATIATYLAATKALELPIPLNYIASALITAAGLANVAKISGIGAEEGGLIHSNYSKKKGKTDTIPMWLAPNEYVVSAKRTSKHLPLLEALNKGDDKALSKVLVDKYGTLLNFNGEPKNNKIMISTQKVTNDTAYIGKLEQTIENLSNKIDLLNKESKITTDFHFSNEAKIKGNDIELISNKVKRQKLRRF